MRNFVKMIALLGIALISLVATRPVLAFPPLPSSFYGTVKVNAANVPDGTLVEASVNGKVYAQTKTLTYQGDSVYSLDVLGDDTDTSVVDGGRDGDKVIFTVAGQVAEPTGTWKGGTNVVLNLSLSKAGSQDTPPPITPASANPLKGSASPGKSFTVIGILVVAVLILSLWLVLRRKSKR
jgi:hypothetical protein